MQLFEKYMRVNAISSKLPLPQPTKPGSVCKLCGTPLLDLGYPTKGLIPNTFTDLEVWRRVDSYVLCHACATTLRDGFNKGRSDGFAAVVTPEGLFAQFPWHTVEWPWFRMPEGAPNVLVYPGMSYRQKHRLFHAEACQDERYLSFWHGDIGQRFIPRSITAAVAHLEDTWMETGYPVKREVGDAVRSVLVGGGAADLIGHTINLIESRKKAHWEEV